MTNRITHTHNVLYKCLLVFGIALPIIVFQRIQWQKYLSLKGLEPATSCVRYKDTTTVPARHMWETGPLNWAQFMFQWFIRFPEFAEITEFSERSAPFRKNSIVFVCVLISETFPLVCLNACWVRIKGCYK